MSFSSPLAPAIDGHDLVDRAQAACADATSIIDDFPPHAWTGRGATRVWYLDMARMATEYAMSEWSVTLDEPRHVAVSEGSAYVVAPIAVRWLQDGAPTARRGLMTVALREHAERWRISACAWTWDCVPVPGHQALARGR